MKKLWLAALLAISLFSCNKENLESKLPPVKTRDIVNNLPVTALVEDNHPGYTIPQNFQGLSFETAILVDSPEFLNADNRVLIQMVKNLGGGVLRIGGNSSDEINWIGTPHSLKYPPNSLTSYDIDRLAAFDKAISWPILFGLNLANHNGPLSGDEATYVQRKLPDLYAFQSGNEPDVFNLGLRPPSYNFNNYKYEWNGYFTSIRNAVPGAAFAGPDVNPFNSKWIDAFAAAEHQNINLIDGHYYNTGPASAPSISIDDILTENVRMAGYLGTMRSQSEQYKIPFRISECNSVFGQGKPGVSDVFASALWALDFMWQVAEYHGQGVNFHAGGQAYHYSPIGTKNGVFSAMPEYYAMLAFKQAAVGQTIVPVKLSLPDYNLSVHACVNTDGTRSITIINEEPQSSFAFTIQLAKPAATVKVARLKAPLINVAMGTTYAGSQVNPDGTFTPNITEQYNISGNSFVINVPAGSAAVVMVQ